MLIRNLGHRRVSASALGWALGRLKFERPLSLCRVFFFVFCFLFGLLWLIVLQQSMVVERSEILVIDIAKLALLLPLLLLQASGDGGE